MVYLHLQLEGGEMLWVDLPVPCGKRAWLFLLTQRVWAFRFEAAELQKYIWAWQSWTKWCRTSHTNWNLAYSWGCSWRNVLCCHCPLQKG